MEQMQGGQRDQEVDVNILSPPLSATLPSTNADSIEQPPNSQKQPRPVDFTSTITQPQTKKPALSCPVAALKTTIGDDLGEYIVRDTALLRKQGWNKFVLDCRGRGDFAELSFDHPARDLLKRYKVHGVPVKSHIKPWSRGMLDRAIKRGVHKSCYTYLEFLEEEFKDMINKGNG